MVSIQLNTFQRFCSHSVYLSRFRSYINDRRAVSALFNRSFVMDSFVTSTPVQNGGTDHPSGGAGGPPAATTKGKPKGLIEKTYQKKSQLEHILLRPDTYIGSVEPVTESMWVYDGLEETMVQRELTYVPGLYKIFDEILVNAADNKQRDDKMDTIKIDIIEEENKISIWNNGKGIPVVEHKDEKMYVPTMIFGHLLTSSNYNDEEQKVTGGRNGYGAKLCNIFSKSFTVETASKEYKRKLKQTWTDNMSCTKAPAIKDSSEDYTKITFIPDLAKFNMQKLTKDIIDLFSRRAYDVAASTRGVKVFLNGKRIPVKNFKDYIELYTKKLEIDGKAVTIIYESPDPRWEVAIVHSDVFRQVSFVNSIATTKGGRHVDYVTDMITKQLAEKMKTKNKKDIAIKPAQIKNHLWIFVNCLIVNPTFDSQTKENMTLQAKNFGSKCPLSEKFINQVNLKSGIVDAVKAWAQYKQKRQLENTGGKKQRKLQGIQKLEDANDAGTKHSIDCTLILTEGDSAKTMAVSGLAVIGRDRYGIFPLRGKLLNVREATHKQILENVEINAIVKIVGLQYKKKYETMEDLKTLRYGKIMIMTDQDQDGSHIKGLIINFIHHNWPSLLRLPFLEEFITPILKARKGEHIELSFFSIPEFEEWKNETQDWHTYKIKYYKGLGTSTSDEAKEYFSNMTRHRIRFRYQNDDDDSHIQMAFSKKMIEARKDWLTNWMTESKRRKEMGLGDDYLYTKDTRAVSYKDFINKELVLFSNMDNERSIPNMMDGLKPGSRKVLFTVLKRNVVKELKVAQLAGSVAEISAYHHGEQSLMSTIINLAQNFVGSNNINLLVPQGQFGTRLQGGKDAASPRYIFTYMSPLTRLIFHPQDDPLLTYLRDDNLKVEPTWYVPIIPMVLVNGADGIGTGWMTKIPNHDPREIIQNLHRMIKGDEPLPMKPFYKNFKGEIEKVGEYRFVTNGEVGVVNSTKFEITELPIGTWTQVYKESVLEPMVHGGEKDKTPPFITDYREYNTDITVKFQISMTEEKLKKAENEGLHKVFKLQSVLPITSMCSFDRDNVLRRYDSTTQILKEFFTVRLEFYNKRKMYLIGMLEAELRKLSNQARFIVDKCDGDLRIENRKKKEMISELLKRNYDPDPVRMWKMKVDREGALEEEAIAPADSDDESEAASNENTEQQLPINEDFDYLLGMKLWYLTVEKKNELLKIRDNKEVELQVLKKRSPEDLWVEDLDALLVKLDQVEKKERDRAAGIKGKNKNASKEKGSKKNKIGSSTDILPSPAAVRVVPKYDEIMKKAEKLDAAKENKGKRVAKKKGDAEGEEDAEGVDGEKKVKKEPKEKKQKQPKSSPAKKEKKSHDFSDSDDDEKDFDDSDSPVETITPARTTSRRAAATKISFKFGSDSSESFSEDDDNDNAAKELPATGDGSFSDVDSPVKKPQKKPAAPLIDSESDDSYKGLSDEDNDSDYGGGKKKKKSPVKKGKTAKTTTADSDSDTFGPKKKAAPKADTKKKKTTEPKPKAKKEPAKKATATKSKAAPKRTKVDSEDSDEINIPDFDGGVSKKTKKKQSGSDSEDDTLKKTKKRPAPSDSDDDFNKILGPPKKQEEAMSADQLFDSVRESTLPKRTTAVTKKPKNMFSFEDSDEDKDSASSGSDYKPSPKSKRSKAAASKPAGGKRAAAAKKPKYHISDGSDDDF